MNEECDKYGRIHVPKPSKPEDIMEAHKWCKNNRENLTKSYLCGCFYCLKIFKTLEITEWIKEKKADSTAICPHCSIDSVIPENSGFPLTTEFLAKMKEYWFSVP